MKHKIASWIASLITIATLLGMGLTIFPAVAEDDNKLSVPVAFGRGLNTNQQGNRVNHVIIPNEINAKLDGVVHFLVAGFHQVVVYNPGTKHDDVDVPTSGTFINDPINPDPDLFYLGINPAGGPPPGTPVTTNPSNAMNRVESVSFTEPGTYLVICNIRGHFLDGMFAVVKVKEVKDDDD